MPSWRWLLLPLVVLGDVTERVIRRNNVKKPGLGSTVAATRKAALAKAFEDLEESRSVVSSWTDQQGKGTTHPVLLVYFAASKTDACVGISHGEREDGCYLIDKRGRGLDAAGLRGLRSTTSAPGQRAVRLENQLATPDDLRSFTSDMYSFVLLPDGFKEESDPLPSEEDDLSKCLPWRGGMREDGLPYIADDDAKDTGKRIRLVVHPNVLRLLWLGILEFPAEFSEPRFPQVVNWVDAFTGSMLRSELVEEHMAGELEKVVSRRFKEPPSTVNFNFNLNEGSFQFGSLNDVHFDAQGVIEQEQDLSREQLAVLVRALASALRKAPAETTTMQNRALANTPQKTTAARKVPYTN